MTWKMTFLCATALGVLAAGAGPQIVGVAHASGCEAGDKIDGSTAAGTKKKMESAGFHHVRDLKKGCDNVWHAAAFKDGDDTRVLLTPQGEVMHDGD